MDIKKFIDIVSESSSGGTSAGSVAEVSKPLGSVQVRLETNDSTAPQVIEYGNWENSALTTSSKLKKERKKAAKVVKSIYGEEVVSEEANPKQQAAIAIAKKAAVGESKSTNRKTVLEYASTPITNRKDYLAKRKALQDLQISGTSADKKLLMQKRAELERQAKELGFALGEEAAADKLPGTPVVSLADFDDRDNTKNKYGQTVPKKLKKDDPRVKFHKEPDEEGVAEGMVGNVVVHNYTKMPIELKPGQAQIHGWGPNDQPIYRVKGADGKEVITGNKKKMMIVAQGQGVAEGGIIKSIKRGLQGWDKNAVGPGGEKLGDPRDIVKRAKAMDTDTAKKVRSGLDAASDHSPAGLQKRVLDRKLKGVAEGSDYDNANAGLQRTVDFAKQHGYKVYRSKAGKTMKFVNNELNHELWARVDNDPHTGSINVNFADYTSGISGNDDASYFDETFKDAYEEVLADHRRQVLDLNEQGVAEGTTQKYEMMLRNGHVKKFVAKDDADAKRIAKGNGAKSVIKLKGNVPGAKILEQDVEEGLLGTALDKVKNVGKKVLDVVAPDDEELLRQLQRSMGIPASSQHGKKSMAEPADDKLDEADLIINPASISRKPIGLIKKVDHTDHEVEMAKSDLYQASKNALAIFQMIKDVPEEVGIEGWVQEKIIKANDYLNTIREYLEGKQLESMDGVAPSTKQVCEDDVEEGKTGPGLWANIHAKRKRIKSGSGEHMRKPGSKGAPKASDFRAARSDKK